MSVPKTFTTTVTPAAKNVSVSGTTTGSVSLTTSNVEIKPQSTGTAANKYTPAGDVSAPTISVATAGTTTRVYSITAVGTLPTLTANVENEMLTISFDQGTLPTKGSKQTVKTGDASYTATAPTFTGTDTYFATATKVGTAASFTGASMTSTGSYTPATPTVSTTVATSETKTVTVS